VALASTDCTSQVASVTVETGGEQSGYVVKLTSGLSFARSPKSVNYREILGMVRTQMRVQELTGRFAADGINCKQTVRRTDLVAIILAAPRSRL
jgi:hypothetical protein